MTAVGAWTAWYQHPAQSWPLAQGGSLTYGLAAEFLKDCDTVEDWGCGLGYMRTLLPPECYWGIDGSDTPCADAVVDLEHYTSSADGILVRHVLEHNYGWERILWNAVASFRRRLVLVIFTPFAERTQVLRVGGNVVVPDIAFAKADLTRHLRGLHWHEETHATKTQYGTETIFFVSREAPCS